VDRREALTFVRKHGVVLESARGPIPNLAEAIAGGPIRGSWWGHPRSHHMYQVFEAVCDSDQVLVCRLAGGKVTFVHRRLWAALVRLASRLPKRGLAATRDEHTARGHHRTVVTPFPRWVPKEVLARAKRMSVAEAVSEIGAELLFKVSGLKFAQPDNRLKQTARGRPSPKSRQRSRAAT
jgi:hypothetical protein